MIRMEQKWIELGYEDDIQLAQFTLNLKLF